MTLSAEILLVGALTGLAYAILGAGLVLIYRATKVINFAHGEIGAFCALLLGKLVLDYNWNWWLAFMACVLIGGAVGASWELMVVRRLFESPRLILLVATVGISQIMFFTQFLLPKVKSVDRYPTGLSTTFVIGGVPVRGEYTMVLVIVPVLVAGLAYFLSRTMYGITIRAAADNPDATRLAGASVKRVSTVVWALAGMLAAATFILISPLRGVVLGRPTAALGPGLLLHALAAGLVGRMVSLPLTLVGGLVIGTVEAVLFVNVGNPGVIDLFLFLAVLVLIAWRGRGLAAEEGSSFSLTPKVKAIPARAKEIFLVRHLGRVVGAASLLFAIALPLVFSTAGQQFLFSRTLTFAVIGLSVVVLTGWAGNLSLGQFAFVGLGAFLMFAQRAAGVPFLVAVVGAVTGGALAALLIGVPALRIRGLALAIATLAFAVAARSYILGLPVLTKGDAIVFSPRGSVGPLDLTPQRNFYYVCLGVLVLCFLLVSQLRRTGIGRAIIAVRDNEQNAAAAGISPTVAKLTAFGLSGALAALGGALLATGQVQFGAVDFGPEESLRIVAMTIIGGLGSPAGAVLGAVYLLGVPALLGNSPQIQLLTSGAGLLLLLLYLPGGLLQVGYRIREVLVDVLLRRSPPREPREAAERLERSGAYQLAPREVVALDEEALALRVDDLVITFGGVRALDGVSIVAHQQETLGLIGSNGAGKSTLMNAVGGFITPDSGRVAILGTDVTGTAAHTRHALGMARIFQDARLFGNLTVRETITVILESRERSELVPSMLALPPSRRAERSKRAATDELIDFVGLGRYADSFNTEISTGTRRIVELACLVGIQAQLLMLDEPTAGVAQRETEAFGPLIERIRSELGATLVIIEHDMPLVMALSDRIYCMSAGQVIAEGTPNSVRNDPQVIAAYLGTDVRAIERSDQAQSPDAPVASLTRDELLERARPLSAVGTSRMCKRELIDLIEGRS